MKAEPPGKSPPGAADSRGPLPALSHPLQVGRVLAAGASGHPEFLIQQTEPFFQLLQMPDQPLRIARRRGAVDDDAPSLGVVAGPVHVLLPLEQGADRLREMLLHVTAGVRRADLDVGALRPGPDVAIALPQEGEPINQQTLGVGLPVGLRPVGLCHLRRLGRWSAGHLQSIDVEHTNSWEPRSEAITLIHRQLQSIGSMAARLWEWT